MTTSARRPNIIFLMTDQQRWDALGCADPVVQTPNLDALAARGVRFEQAICNVPMCVASRHSMMLGLYGSQCGVRHNTNMYPTDDYLPLPPLPQRLADLGYQTAGFGKTHWYLGDRIGAGMPTEPSRRGFEVRAHAEHHWASRREPDQRLMGEEQPDVYGRYVAETEPYGGGGESPLGYTGKTSDLAPEEHREAWLTDRTLEFLDNDRDPNRPLFLYVSFDFPHAGFNVPPGYEERYRLEDIPDRPQPPWTEQPPGHVGPPSRWSADWEAKSPEERRLTTLRYYALCTFVDEMFGRVLQKLDAMGELDNSLILFTSDHGEMLGDRGHRFSKYCLYDGSVRVPLILAGQGIAPEQAGTVDSRYAELIDLLPTLLDAAGEMVPPELPGESLLRAARRRGSFAEMHGSGYEPVQKAPAYMWRTTDWKLILYLPVEIPDAMAHLDAISGELYDLKADPHEWHNLYDVPEHLAIREQLTRELLMHLACAWATYPFPVGRARIAPVDDAYRQGRFTS